MIIKTLKLNGMVFPVAFTDGALSRYEEETGLSSLDFIDMISEGRAPFRLVSKMVFYAMQSAFSLLRKGVRCEEPDHLTEMPEGYATPMDVADIMVIGDIEQVAKAMRPYMPIIDDVEKNVVRAETAPARRTGKK